MEKEEISLKIRKYHDILATAGYGVIVFVLWNLLKTIIYIRDIIPLLNDETRSLSDEFAGYLFSGIAIIFYIFVVIAGIFAIKEGKGGRRFNVLGRVLPLILSVISISFIIVDIMAFVRLKQFDTIYLINIVSDFICNGILFALTISAFILKKLYKLEGAQNER